MPWQAPHKIGGRLDERSLQRSARNLHAEAEAYDYLLAPDSRALLRQFIDDNHKLIGVCLKQRAVQGVESVAMHELMRDLVHKLVYQELTSRRRAMGDRGIRRICGNIELAEHVYKQLKLLPQFTPRDRLLMRIIHVHQDLGNTAYAARVSFRGGKLHRAYGARIFTDELNGYRILLNHKELELTRSAVATHSSEELPFIPQRVLAVVRAVDHLAPFAPYRVYKHFEAIDGIDDYLDDLLERARAGDVDRYLAAKESLRDILADDAIPPPLRDDLWACFRPLEKLADPIELGELAGEVTELRYDGAAPGTLTAILEPDPFAQKYQALFDQQQDQLLRLARSTNVSAEQLRSGSPQLRFQAAEYGALLLQR